ncbi:hypothetical protein E2C01_048461 [Portunus trituberculatus]|uniref:Uncharacterized protein n=1 Tax=Portunus trituberculatus TaxID=210409 RepID=A0A5B7G383_PORTR|nr:hypothetical protein [Portunus trituberculatus]
MSSKLPATPSAGELKAKRPRKSLSYKKSSMRKVKQPTSLTESCSCPNPLSPTSSNKQQV